MSQERSPFDRDATCRGRDESRGLLDRAERGDRAALDALFSRYHDRLIRMVRSHLDRRMRDRVDAADILQEANLEAWIRLRNYLENPVVPFFVWLRFLTRQKLRALRRHHLVAKKRDARREVGPPTDPTPSTSRIEPPVAAIRAEERTRLHHALDRLDPSDRQILSLRHLDQLTNAETARSIGIGEDAASKRCGRAMARLRDVLTAPRPEASAVPS